MRRNHLLFLFGLSTLLIPGASYSDGGRWGTEFQVNRYTTGSQGSQSVAMLPSGKFIVVWSSVGSYGPDSSSRSVQGQLFGANGDMLGLQFQVNTYTNNEQTSPHVDFDGLGGFVVVWHGKNFSSPDNSADAIWGQRFTSDGALAGVEFRINTYTTLFQLNPKVAVAANGDFVVIWTSTGSSGSDNDGRSIQGQRFVSDGSPAGAEFQVNTYTTGWQYPFDVEATSLGDFVVVWESDGSFGSDDWYSSIQGQRFASDGLELGTEFQVNFYTQRAQSKPSLAMDRMGNFVVAWNSGSSEGSDSSGDSIQAQRFSSAGLSLGAQFQVNSHTTNHQTSPAVSGSRQGFTVVWKSLSSPGSDDDGRSIQGRRLTIDGEFDGEQFQVNTYTTSHQETPRVAMAKDGEFVVVWGSSSSTIDPDSTVLGQRYRSIVFQDGFESGDTTAWSAFLP